MEQLDSYADSRLIAACVYCGAGTGTRDHCPSRVLLDEPYPENLPHVPACKNCNGGFSLDEEYFACLAECARTGTLGAVERPKIRRILEDSPALAARIMQARTVLDDGQITFQPESERVRCVVLKLARGHAAFELSEPVRGQPSHLMITPLHLLADTARHHFETAPSTSIWPEVGSRAMQRMVTGAGLVFGSDWIHVQEGQYRYLAVAETVVMVRIVVGEYLACEVIWNPNDL